MIFMDFFMNCASPEAQPGRTHVVDCAKLCPQNGTRTFYTSLTVSLPAGKETLELDHPSAMLSGNLVFRGGDKFPRMYSGLLGGKAPPIENVHINPDGTAHRASTTKQKKRKLPTTYECGLPHGCNPYDNISLEDACAAQGLPRGITNCAGGFTAATENMSERQKIVAWVART